MKMTAEKIEILKELQKANRRQYTIVNLTGLKWDTVESHLKWLLKNNFVDLQTYNWRITSAGIAAIEKYDKEGAQDELFET